MRLLAIRQEDYISSDGTVDVYAFIRSKEVREYLRKYKKFAVRDKAHIILCSMNPMKEKIHALEILANETATEMQEKDRLLDLTAYLKEALQEIYSNGNKLLCSFPCRNLQHLNRMEILSGIENAAEYFSTFEEWRSFCDSITPAENETLWKYSVDLVYPSEPYGRNRRIAFDATYFDGKIEIYSLEISDDFAKGDEQKIDAWQRYAYEYEERYSLPFQAVSRVKWQTPFMENALRGILRSSMDAGGCWYHFFYPDTIEGKTAVGEMVSESIDFSDFNIDFGINFSVLDWIQKDDMVCQGVESEKGFIEDFSQIRKIVDVDAGSGGVFRVRIDHLVSVEEAGESKRIKLHFSDDSGDMIGTIIVRKNDSKWVEEYARCHGILCIVCNEITMNPNGVRESTHITDVYKSHISQT